MAAVSMAVTNARRCLTAMIRSRFVPTVPGAVQTIVRHLWAMRLVHAQVLPPTAAVSNARAALPKQRLEPVCQPATTVLLWMRRAVSTPVQPARCRNVWDMSGRIRVHAATIIPAIRAGLRAAAV